MFLLALLASALGTAIASKLEDMQGFPLIMNLVFMPLFFLSGALFPLREIPTALDIVTKINPLTYAVDAIRGALTGQNYFNLSLDFLIVAGLTVIVVAIGARLFSRMEV